MPYFEALFFAALFVHCFILLAAKFRWDNICNSSEIGVEEIRILIYNSLDDMRKRENLLIRIYADF